MCASGLPGANSAKKGRAFRPLLDRARRQPGDVVVEEEDVEDDERDRSQHRPRQPRGEDMSEEGACQGPRVLKSSLPGLQILVPP